MVLEPSARFWEGKNLAQLTPQQWEALCDGCGRCCLQKLRRPKTGKVVYTSVACRLLDLTTCRCKTYRRRHRLVPECCTLTPQRIPAMGWLPRTCAYRLLALGKPLPNWHPLVSGDPESVHTAGISIRYKAISENEINFSDIEHFVLPERL